MIATQRLARLVKILVLAYALYVPIAAHAAVDVPRAEIVRIGLIAPSVQRGAMVQLRDLAGSPAWSGSRQFFLSQSVLGKDGLAMVLTAFATGRSIFVRIAGTAQPLSLITIVYVNAD